VLPDIFYIENESILGLCKITQSTSYKEQIKERVGHPDKRKSKAYYFFFILDVQSNNLQCSTC